jgi:ABC-type sugar transport system substrate-binding protein
MVKKRTPEQIKSRRKFLQGGVALGATAPILFANNAQAHGSRLKDNMDQEYVIVSIVSTHPFWNDLKNGAQDAADDLGVKFSYVGPAGFDVEGQVQAMEQILIKKTSWHRTSSFYRCCFSSNSKSFGCWY